MTMPREHDAAVLLADGSLLAMGGDPGECCGDTPTAEVFTVPVITVTPAKGPAGESITISGAGFDGYEAVTVSWDGGRFAAGSTTTSSSGTVVIKTSVPSSAKPGSHTILAVGQQSRARATFIFDVTAPP